MNTDGTWKCGSCGGEVPKECDGKCNKGTTADKGGGRR